MLQIAAGFLAILALANITATTLETRSHPAPGAQVVVGGRIMHIQTRGHGQHDVVLLSGLGTVCPAIDFAPLVDALETDFRVTVVEYFGYGWSDRTSVPRTNRNIVNELRAGLLAARVPPPYVLVPHSMSGIYALYYANAHPGEVSAVIGLDTTVPDQEAYVHDTAWPALWPIANAAGIVRLTLLLDPGMAGYDPPAFTEAERDRIRMMAARNYGNRTVADELRRLRANLAEVQGRRFPQAIPTSFVLSRESMQGVPASMPGLDWLAAHRDLLSGCPRGEIVIVDGGHNVHWRNSGRIAGVVRRTVALLDAAGP